MTVKQTRRLLIIAFSISLIIHAIVALKIDWPFSPPKDQVETVRIEHTRTLRVSRVPTPPPHTPPPTTPRPQPSVTATSLVKAGKPRPEGPGNGRAAGFATAPPPATAPPTPAASATPNCARTDTPVTLVSKPEQPDIAAAARGDATNGTAKVHVILDPNGVVTQAAVVQSSGNPSLDLVALSVAKGAHYAPATHACKPMASDYTFVAKFSPW